MKANPAFSMDDYLWKLSVPFTKIMSYDASQVIYLTESQQKKYKEMKRTNTAYNKVYNDSNLDAFEAELGI